MTAQRELMERELEVERVSLRQSPEGEALELRGMYEQRGIDPEVARDMVHEVMADPQLALETHAREELGISPEHLGSPVQSALSSFFTFALGAFIPLVPWLFTKGTAAIVASVVLSAVAAIAIGVVLATFTHRSMCALRTATTDSDRGGGGGDLRGGPGDRDRAGVAQVRSARRELDRVSVRVQQIRPVDVVDGEPEGLVELHRGRCWSR